MGKKQVEKTPEMLTKLDLSKEMMRRLIGDRTISQVAEDSGMSVSSISCLARGVSFPKPETIEKLTNPECNPQGGVTCEMFMDYVGYSHMAKSIKRLQRQSEIIAGSAAVTGLVGLVVGGVAPGNPVEILSGILEANGERLSRKADKKNEELQQYIEKLQFIGARIQKRTDEIKYTIMSNMFNGGLITAINGVTSPPDTLTDFQPSFGFKINVKNSNIDEWLFVAYIVDSELGSINYLSPLTQLMTAVQNPRKKISIVLEDKAVYEQLLTRKGNLPYRGEVSVILLEEGKNILLAEEYISHFYENDDSKEFKII